MRFILLLLTLALCTAISKTHAQSITYTATNASVKEIIATVKQQAKFVFVYDEETIKASRKISITADAMPVQEFLALAFRDQPFTWTIRNQTVVIKRKILENKEAVLSKEPPGNIKGRVVDSLGRPLAGATIAVKNSKASAVTNSEGGFNLDINEGEVLIVSYVGYEKKSVAVTASMMAANDVVIGLRPSVAKLEEVEVVFSTGYQDIPKERATGSFVLIDKELFNRSVGPNVLDRIMDITSGLGKGTSGFSNPLDNITIRGVSTFNGNKRPLLVVDNFPYESDPNLLNPNDVESITILRDAAAASIWGAKAGNGVIVITTKKGKFNSRTNVGFSANVNIVEKPDLYKANMISPADAVEYEKKLFTTGVYNAYDDLYPSFNYFPGLSPVVEILLAERREDITSEEADAQLNHLAGHDLRDDINKYLLRTGINQQYSLSVGGGTDKIGYYGSITYDRSLSATVGNESGRFIFNLNQTYRPVKNLELNTYIIYSQGRDRNNGIPYNDYLADGRGGVAPYLMLADANGSPLHIPNPGLTNSRSAYVDTLNIPGLLDWHYKPLDEIKNKDNTSQVFNARFGGALRYTILQGLSIELNGQYDRGMINTENYASTQIYSTRTLINSFMYLDPSGIPQYPVPLNGILDYTIQKQITYDLRGKLSFNRTYGDHNISGIVGMDVREMQSDANTSRKYGYDPSLLTYARNINYGTMYTLRPSGSGFITNADALTGTQSRFLNYYTNVGYSLMNKYIVTASARVDGSNSFGTKANQKFSPFWSIGSSWNISKEKFFKSGKISSLTFRATYGFNGNMGGGSPLPVIAYDPGYSPYNNFQQYAYLSAPPNPGLTWEKVEMINMGIGFNVFNNRLSGMVDYYSKRAFNLIGFITPALSAGLSGGSYRGNYASLRGRGVDISLNGIILDRKLKLNTSLSFSYNTSKVTEYFVDSTILQNGNDYAGNSSPAVVGKPLDAIYSYQWAGLDGQTGSPMGIIDGKVVPFKTVLGYTDGKPNTKPEDVVYHGRGSAPFFGNILNTITYGGISLSFNISYKFGYYFFRPSINYLQMQNAWGGGHSDYALRWQKPGDELYTTVPAMPATPDARSLFYSRSEVLVERGDHIRLNDLRLSYNMDKANWQKLPFNTSVFVYASNLGLLWRKNGKGIDPDVAATGIPAARTIAIGLTINY